MTTKAKASIAPDVSLLVDGQLANASDVTTAISDIETELQSGALIGVTSNDTHVGTLDDKLTISGSGISKSEQNDGADETLQLALSTALEALNALLPASGKIQAGAIDSESSNSGYALTADGSGNASFASVAGLGSSPLDITGTAGETLSERDMVYLDESAGTWKKIDTDATGSILAGAVRGCVVESGGISSASTGAIRIWGEATGFSGLSAWSRVYASTTAGGYTQTKPSVSDGGGQVAVIEMGIANSTTSIVINPKPIRYIKRETLANDGTLTIEHHSDASTRQREVQAYVATPVAGSSLTSYASSNQDVDVPLRDQTVATYGSDECTGGTASADVEDNPASSAFDDDGGTNWQVSSSSSGTIQYDFGSGVTKTIQKYTITNDASTLRSPTAWTFDGSNNGSTWTTLDTQSSVSWSAGNTTNTYTLINTTAYRYYRLDVTNNGGGSNLNIAEIEMMEAATYTDGDDKLAQSFQVTGTQTVQAVDLYLKKTGSPTGTLTLRIETDSAGSPSGTLVDANATTTVSESTLSTSYSDITFTFGTSFSISGSTTYWVVLSTDRSASQADYVSWGADGSSPGYTDGQMKSELSSTWSAESKDAIFDVLDEGTEYDEPCVTGRWSGGTRDVAIRFDDGAGSNANTNTTFKNVSGASMDLVCEVEVE